MAKIEHAVVLGGSMAGMLAAAALARHAERVTVVERDEWSEQPTHRKGTPQDWQSHGLLDRGQQIIQELLPGVLEELEARGARRYDIGSETRWFHVDRWKARMRTGYELRAQSRPLLESVVRRRLARNSSITWLEGTRAVAPIVIKGKVRGVLLERGGQWSQPCDLLVDATGRGSRTPAWLEDLGLARPSVDEVRFDLRYATRTYRMEEAWPDASLFMIYGARPQYRRHGLAMAVEGDRWSVTLMGYGGDSPPGDVAGYEAYARSLARPEIYELMMRSRPLSEVRAYHFQKQRWHRYDRVRLPQGLAVLGDALCSLDPVFGQGISIAAMEVEILGRLIEERGGFDSRLFARRCAKFLRSPWMVTCVEAFRYPTTTGRKPWGTGLVQRVLDRVYECSAEDPEVHRTFLDVVQFQAEPTALLSPRMLARLWRGPQGRLPMLPSIEEHSSSIQLPLGSV